MSSPDTSEKPKVKIIYRKKKGGGHGHHGGAWKVAFADFMTAMMALFLVLWIMSQSQEVKQAVAVYFRHPTDYEGKPDAILRGNQGLMDNKSGRLDAPPSVIDSNTVKAAGGGGATSEGSTPQSVSGADSPIPSDSAMRARPVERPEEQEKDELRTFLDLADELWKQLGMDPSFQRVKDQILIQTIEDGLVVQIVERPGQPLLEEHAAKFRAPIEKALHAISKRLLMYPNNKIEIDGHGPGLASDPSQTWLGSMMLADLARKELQVGGLKPGQVSKVSGCGLARPLEAKTIADPLNRRISILVRPRQWKPDRY